MIIRATSLSGSEHIITGFVKDKQTKPFESEQQAVTHPHRIGWTNIRFCVDKVVEEDRIRRVWDDQTITYHEKRDDI